MSSHSIQQNITSNKMPSAVSHEMDDDLRRIDEDFCRDFACCGVKLKTMHDLLEHYETVHVVVKDEDLPPFQDEAQLLLL